MPLSQPDFAPPAKKTFVESARWLRTIGFGLGGLAVASVLYQNGSAPGLWVLLAFNGLLWPHLAYRRARRAIDPAEAEKRNMYVDAMAGGLWVAAMQFNALPSALLVTMLAMDKISVGGWRMCARAVALQAAVCLLVTCAWFLIYGEWPFRPTTSMLSIGLSLPFLVVYPLLISASAHALARLVRRQNRDLAKLSVIDAPTGLLNRIAWEKVVARELRHLHRFGHSVSLLMIDIDHFKTINDRFGHPVGDAVIAAVAGTIKECIRDIDVAGRYGGDEFCVLLAHTGEHAATVAAERIRARVAAVSLPDAPELRCTLSIGIAAATREMPDTLAWVERADAALYRAKMRGRNQTVRMELVTPTSGLSSA